MLIVHFLDANGKIIFPSERTHSHRILLSVPPGRLYGPRQHFFIISSSAKVEGKFNELFLSRNMDKKTTFY
jgi:hypothetical protein